MTAVGAVMSWMAGERFGTRQHVTSALSAHRGEESNGMTSANSSPLSLELSVR